MATQSKIAYSLPEPVPQGAKTPVGMSALISAILAFIRPYLPAELATLIVSMATPGSSKADSLHLKLGPDGVPYSLRRYLSGTGWVPMQLTVPTGTVLPTIPGLNPSDRAYAQGMLYLLSTTNTLYSYDSINNLWRSANSNYNINSVSGTYQALTTDDILSSTGGNFTINLADPTTCPGKQQYVITDGSCSSSAAVTLAGNIRGATTSVVVSSPWVCLMLVSNGTTWLIMNTNITLVYNTGTSTWSVNAAGKSVVSTGINYSIQLGDDTIRTTAANITMSYPDPTTCTGKTVSVITDSTCGSGAPVNLSGNIHGGATTIAISTPWTRTTYTSDGTTWC